MKDKGDLVVADTSILIHYLNGEQIAATAIALGFPLATSDKDFTALKDIHEVRLHKPKG